MNKKLSVLRRITAIVLCVTLLSSQVVVANDEDSERMDVQTNSEITDISEQDSLSRSGRHFFRVRASEK